LGIGTQSPNYNLTFGNATNQIIGIKQNSYGNGANLTVQAATTSGAGGAFSIYSGTAGNAFAAICVNSISGDVFAVGATDIYKNLGGTGTFTAMSSGLLYLGANSGIAVNSSNGDIWVTSYAGLYIAHYTVASGVFTTYSGTSGINWLGIAVNSSTNDVYAYSSTNGNIYKNTGGNGTFTSILTTTTATYSVACDNSGNIWIGYNQGVFKSTGGGSFIQINSTLSNIYGISVNTSNGDVWVSDSGVDIYKQSLGSGQFVAQGVSIPSSWGIAVNSNNGTIWVASSTSGIYYQTLGTNATGGYLNLNTGVGTGNANNAITFNTSTPTVSGSANQVLSEKMRITGQGYVGINTTTPQYYLDISGSTRLANTLYFGGSLTSSTDYSHSVFNNSGDLVFQPRIDAVSAFTFKNASGTTSVFNINTLNPAVAINGNLSITGTLTGGISGTPGNILIINSTGNGFIDSGIPIAMIFAGL
jgi:hypothetical protein